MELFGKVFRLLGLLLTVAVQLKAQNIYTDRPTQTTTSAIVPIGAFQLESGFQLTEFSQQNNFGGTDRTQLFSLNNTLLRYGISERIELRFFHEIATSRLRVDGATAFSNDVVFAPTLIGAKFKLVKNNPKFPDVGLIVATGGGLFEETGNGLQTDIRMAVDANIGNKFSISSNVGFTMTDGAENSTPFYTLVLGQAVNEKLGVFIESYGSFPSQGRSDHAMDAGLTYLLNSSVQVDFYGGTGLSNGNFNLLLGFGLSKRFLKN